MCAQMYVHCCQTVVQSPGRRSELARGPPARGSAIHLRHRGRSPGARGHSTEVISRIQQQKHRQVKLLLGLQISILGICLVGKDWAPSPWTPWCPGPHHSGREVPPESSEMLTLSFRDESGQGFLQRNLRLVATGLLCNLVGHNL